MASKHDEIVKKTVNRLRDSPIDYEFIESHFEYNKGEIDVWARYMKTNGKVYDLFFEIKSNDSPRNVNKAVSQLERAVTEFSPFSRSFSFVVFPTYMMRIK